MKYITIFFQLFLSILISQTVSANEDLYRAKDGKVDPATFIGWSAFHHACVSCHGVGASGTEAGPDLTETADRLSPEQFRLRVLHRKIVRFTGDDWRRRRRSA